MASAPALRDAPPQTDRGFFGHPRGLATLFFSEMWERFSYYGMRGFLILYMTAAVSAGGLGLDTATAAAIYGTYTSMVYLMSVPGGWLADRLIGQRRAVVFGGLLIAFGHFSLAVPLDATFYLGLVLVVLGTGLLKPNISVMVGQLYGPKDLRRDSGFSIFYMGINVGGLLGPLATGFLAQSEFFRGRLAAWGADPDSAWHWGFGAAGVGMCLGLLQYLRGQAALGDAGRPPALSPHDAAVVQRRLILGIAITGGLLVTWAALGLADQRLVLTAQSFSTVAGYSLLVITVVFFGRLFLDRRWTAEERRRLWLIGVFFVAAALFWSVFEQAGSTLNLFADRSTRNEIFGYTFPSSWWQSFNPLAIIVFGPVFAWLWIRLGRRQPETPTKFALGLIGVGLGFLVLVPGAAEAAGGIQVGMFWLTATYLLHTWAELCLSPVGLSAMTKLAPARIVSLMMGVWFLAAAVGNYAGGQMASLYEAMPLERLLFAVALLPLGAGVVMLAARRPLARLVDGRP
jgi:POT family proton-dependent oligopeptide transporter